MKINNLKIIMGNNIINNSEWNSVLKIKNKIADATKMT